MLVHSALTNDNTTCDFNNAEMNIMINKCCSFLVHEP